MELRKYYIDVSRRLEDVQLFVVLIESMFGASMEHVETMFQVDREHYHLERSVQACYMWVWRVMSIRRKVAEGRS